MKGSVGTSAHFVGEKVSHIPAHKFKQRINTLIKAKHCLARSEHLDQQQKEICQYVIDNPGAAFSRQYSHAVYGIWMTLAESGKLRGLFK